MQKNHFFTIEKIQKYQKCPALCKLHVWAVSTHGKIYSLAHAAIMKNVICSYNEKCYFSIPFLFFYQVNLTWGRLF